MRCISWLHSKERNKRLLLCWQNASTFLSNILTNIRRSHNELKLKEPSRNKLCLLVLIIVFKRCDLTLAILLIDSCPNIQHPLQHHEQTN